MSFGIETRDASGKLTFDLFAPVLRQDTYVYIEPWASGVLSLQGTLGREASIRFVRADYSTFDYMPIAPYAYYSGGNLIYQNHSQGHYAIVTGITR